MLTSTGRLLAALAAVMGVVTLLIASVVYDSHSKSTLRQEVQSIASANTSTVRSLSWLGDEADNIEVLLDALSPLGTENYLLLLIDSEGQVRNAGTDSVWATTSVREELFNAIRDSQDGGQYYASEMKFVWARTSIPSTQIDLVTLHQEHDRGLINYINDFGLPLAIMAIVMFWIAAWAALTLGSLFKRLNSQNTQLEEQSQELAESRDRALEARDAKGTFLANMSHEIRTPLTAVIGYSEALLGSDQTKEDRLEAINTIHKSSQHVLQIINQILDLSKIEANKLEIEKVMASPVQLLNDVSSLMRIQAEEKSLSFDVIYKSAIPESIFTDPTRLKQTLLNLFSNAMKFTPEGFVNIEVTCMPEKQLMRFDVKDSGIGMSREQCEKVFEAFTQADETTTRQYGGTGLGLTLSRQFAEKMGGGIYVQSEPGKGSCFTLEISTGNLENVPFINHPEKLAFEENDKPAKPQKYFRGEVLLVEDTEENQRLLAMYARKLGANVTLASNGEEAVHLAAAQPFDLILMDMQMPVMNGIDATLLLRDSGYTRPIVALTANVSSKDRQACTDAGCDGFLAKPVDRARFNQVVSSYLRESRKVPQLGPVVSRLFEEDPELAELVEVYVERLPSMLSDIRTEFENKDWKKMKDLVHQLKGSGGNYGYDELSRIAAKLEFQVMGEHEQEVGELLAELEHYGERIIAGFSRGASDNVAHIKDRQKS